MKIEKIRENEKKENVDTYYDDEKSISEDSTSCEFAGGGLWNAP